MFTDDQNHVWVRRARPLLGTTVMIHVRRDAQAGQARDGSRSLHYAIDAAFDGIERIACAMSAHRRDSDLARLARAQPGSLATLDPHTVRVLRIAQQWHALSRGAFDPVIAARHLAARGVRPAFDGIALEPSATLRDVEIVSNSVVRLTAPLPLDLGGIAKGYAVDRAVEILREHGIASALVNAGGDLRAYGPAAWPVEVRHPASFSRTRRLTGLRALTNSALATSVAAPLNAEFVRTVRRRRGASWQSCTALARDCVTADVLTKWGLQAPGDSMRLRRIVRAYGASLWRS
jgi:thiamine biosynthesis lipoprotein